MSGCNNIFIQPVISRSGVTYLLKTKRWFSPDNSAVILSKKHLKTLKEHLNSG